MAEHGIAHHVDPLGLGQELVLEVRHLHGHAREIAAALGPVIVQVLHVVVAAQQDRLGVFVFVLEDFFEEPNVKQIKIFYHSQEDYENKVINLVDMFGKDFVIDQTSQEKIVFEKLRPAVAGKPRLG